MMGFDKQYMPMPLQMVCECEHKFAMELYEAKCPECGMVYAVTPCHASDAANVMPAGINY